MMKIGVISDIHGDITALDRVMDRFNSIHRVQMVLCAGDLVGRGINPDAVVERIRELGIITVRGNHDQMNYSVSPRAREFLRDLPLEWRADIEGKKLYMCHGKPGSNQWGMYREHLSQTLVEMMLASLSVDVYITGSTHVPMQLVTRRGTVVNPGSLYLFNHERRTSRTYGVLTLPDVHFEVFDLTADAS